MKISLTIALTGVLLNGCQKTALPTNFVDHDGIVYQESQVDGKTVLTSVYECGNAECTNEERAALSIAQKLDLGKDKEQSESKPEPKASASTEPKAEATPKPKASAKPSAEPSPSPSATAEPSPSPSPSASAEPVTTGVAKISGTGSANAGPWKVSCSKNDNKRTIQITNLGVTYEVSTKFGTDLNYKRSVKQADGTELIPNPDELQFGDEEKLVVPVQYATGTNTYRFHEKEGNQISLTMVCTVGKE